jgi:hypothetical protein
MPFLVKMVGPAPRRPHPENASGASREIARSRSQPTEKRLDICERCQTQADEALVRQALQTMPVRRLSPAAGTNNIYRRRQRGVWVHECSSDRHAQVL